MFSKNVSIENRHDSESRVTQSCKKNNMITVEEAQNIISTTIHDFGIVEIPLGEAVGRVLREDLFADRDFPPYHRVTMDGIAIQGESFQN